jgi:hypothetical protein
MLPPLHPVAQKSGKCRQPPGRTNPGVVPGPGAKPPVLRKDKPHVSLYLDKRVQRVIKEIALTYDRKAHDLYIEGINLMLRSYGKPGISDIAPKRDDAGT